MPSYKPKKTLDEPADVVAVLFDLDHTFVDFKKWKRAAIRAAANAMVDLGLDRALDDRVNGNHAVEEVVRRIAEVYKREGIEYQHVFDTLLAENDVASGIRRSALDADKIWAAGVVAYRQAKEGSLQTYPHTVPTLVTLKQRGYQIVVLTDAPRQESYLRMRQADVDPYIDFAVSTTPETRKPDPKPFKLIAARIGAAPRKILVVGDNPKRDITGGNKAGMLTAHASYGQVETERFTEYERGILYPDVPVDPTDPLQIPHYNLEDIQDLLRILPHR